LLFFCPALSQRSGRLLWHGGLGFFAGLGIFRGYQAWIKSNYPTDEERLASVASENISSFDILMAEAHSVVVIMALAALIVCLSIAYRSRNKVPRAILPVAMILAGVIANIVLHYHIGVILIVFGLVLGRRFATISWRDLTIIAIFVCTVFAVQAMYLHASGQFPGRGILRALVGRPSVWPVLRFGQMLPVMATLMVPILLVAVSRVSRGLKIPSFLLFFAFAVWGPLFLIGFFVWWPADRYLLAQIPFLLLSGFAAMAWIAHRLRLDRTRLAVPLVSSALVLASVNPVAFLEAANPKYGRYPDHKGAAEYLSHQKIDDTAIIIAEDVIQQAYYLKRADYWLREMSDARFYTIVKNGLLLDQYTGSIVLGSREALEKVLAENTDKDIFLIGTGENVRDGAPFYRVAGLSEVLQSDQFEEVFAGRDGRTKIWKKARMSSPLSQ
jgi:hypothetical protein